jgi:hypothetical protein
MSWDSFASASRLIELGEQSAMAAMPAIKKWLTQPMPAALPSAIQSIPQAQGTRPQFGNILPNRDRKGAGAFR